MSEQIKFRIATDGTPKNTKVELISNEGEWVDVTRYTRAISIDMGVNKPTTVNADMTGIAEVEITVSGEWHVLPPKLWNLFAPIYNRLYDYLVSLAERWKN